MAAISFKLGTKGDRPPISIFIAVNNIQRVRARVNGVLAFRKYWNDAKQTHTTKHAHPLEIAEINDVNTTLAMLKATITARVAATHPDNITRDWLLNEIEAALHPDKRHELTLLACVDDFIAEVPHRILPSTGKPVSEKTLLQYLQMRRVLSDFLRESRMGDVIVSALDKRFYDRFVSYMYGRGLRPNTVGKHIKNVKVVLHSLPLDAQAGCEFAAPRKCVRIREEVDNVYLTEGELEQIAGVELPEAYLRRARDQFVLLAWTGCRYSDLGKITREHIVEDNGYKYIRLAQHKTGARVTIPVLPAADEILRRYDYSPPAPISNQKFNVFVKDICRRAGIDTEVTITRNMPVKVSRYVTRVEPVATTLPKWECVSAHTARRSFATNMYLRGVPTVTIMAITGHKTERAFLLYIKADADQHAAKMMQMFVGSDPTAGGHDTHNVI